MAAVAHGIRVDRTSWFGQSYIQRTSPSVGERILRHFNGKSQNEECDRHTTSLLAP